jgi:hypothetical protein
MISPALPIDDASHFKVRVLLLVSLLLFLCHLSWSQEDKKGRSVGIICIPNSTRAGSRRRDDSKSAETAGACSPEPRRSRLSLFSTETTAAMQSHTE